CVEYPPRGEVRHASQVPKSYLPSDHSRHGRAALCKERSMLTLLGSRNGITCDGASRRDFLKVGALGLGGLMLPDLLRFRAMAAQNGQPTRNTSVVWLWLGGGPTHVETFDPKMSAPVEFRSTVGAVQTNVPGIEIGGVFPQMARVADKMAFVRS